MGNFYCYNPKLRKYLDQNGTRWIEKGVHFKTGNPFWVFERSTRLSSLLDEFTKLNSKT